MDGEMIVSKEVIVSRGMIVSKEMIVSKCDSRKERVGTHGSRT